MSTALSDRLSAHLRRLRQARGWTLEDLADQSAVSRATLSRIEKGEVRPTAEVLAKLCNAHELSMSRLLGDVEDKLSPHIPRDSQRYWLDPGSGLKRRLVSPSDATLVAEAIECELPPGTRSVYDKLSSPGLEHHLVTIDGRLTLTLGETVHRLGAGDCLRYRLLGSSVFQTPKDALARYNTILVGP